MQNIPSELLPEKVERYNKFVKFIQDEKHKFIDIPVDFEKLLYLWFINDKKFKNVMENICEAILMCRGLRTRIKKHSSHKMEGIRF